jgi:hypothetical protein
MMTPQIASMRLIARGRERVGGRHPLEPSGYRNTVVKTYDYRDLINLIWATPNGTRLATTAQAEELWKVVLSLSVSPTSLNAD